MIVTVHTAMTIWCKWPSTLKYNPRKPSGHIKYSVSRAPRPDRVITLSATNCRVSPRCRHNQPRSRPAGMIHSSDIPVHPTVMHDAFTNVQ